MRPRLVRHRQRRLIVSLMIGAACLLVLPACSWFEQGNRNAGRGPELGKVIAALPDAAVRIPGAARPDHEAVMAAYADVHGQLDDPQLNQAIGRRLADLSMIVAEDRDAAGFDSPYDEAIARYEALLAAAEPHERDVILYQLARAHELAGAADRSAAYLDELIAAHPASPFGIEAHFRLAERAFSAGNYLLADVHYQHVAAAGPISPYWRNAVYMSGWARFRNGDPNGALDRFFLILAASDADGTGMSRDDQELRDDTLRVITLALDDLDGAATLAVEMRSRHQPDWQFQVYEALADHYLQRERYLDSVATWQTFITEHPLDRRAPGAHRGIVETLIAADFPAEARESQAAFIGAYGIRSPFWNVHAAEARSGYLPTLKDYLDELARAEHAAAQSGDRDAIAAASGWYEEIIETFPADPDLPAYLFLYAELLTDAGDHPGAIAAYQRVMREFPDDPNAADAGYAAILGIEALGAAGYDTDRAHERRRIDALVEFAERFPGDGRAPSLRAAAADGLFALDDHAAALAQARGLLDDHPDLTRELRLPMLTVLGHSHFELADYAAAEQAYRSLLADGGDPTRQTEVTERLLAAIYRQGEASEQAGDVDAALVHYLRMREIDADAELTIQGQFDAVAVAEAHGRHTEAARLLERFRADYPAHPLSGEAPRRLAGLYEATGDQRMAANAYLDIADTDADPQARRQALYRAAELELELDQPALAEAHFTRYVREYPQPWDLHLEALDQLDRLTQVSGRGADRRQWLSAKVALEATLREAAADDALRVRAAYLAAGARFELALQARLHFDGVRLVNPLAQSLRRKQEALRETIAAFEAVAGYQVAEYAAAATYQIADLYAALARALLESERPPGLSALELEQYELLLEEEAYPFEEQAIAVHELNMQRSWDGYWDIWVERSFAELGRLVPARFSRQELEVVYVEDIH